MTLNEVAERLAVSPRTVMRWVAQERFPPPSVRVGRVISWRPDVVERWRRKKGGTNGKRTTAR